MLMTARALCSQCDGDIGTGKTEGLCLSYCDSWFLSCMKDYIDPYKQNNQEVLPFCGRDSMICSSVEDTINSSRQFCEAMGYKVQSMDDVSQSGKPCFDGMASSVRLSQAKSKKSSTPSSE